MIGRKGAFSALLSPAGVHAVHYVRTGGEYRVVRYAQRPAAPEADSAATDLAACLVEIGARGRPVSLAVAGFGSCHQILSLPPAARALLRPVVMREMRRFFPHLFAAEGEPILDFVEMEAPELASDGRMRDVMVGAVPAELVDTVAGALAAYGMRLDHWTTLPRAVKRVYELFAADEDSAGLLLDVPGSPLFATFYGGELRLLMEPVTASHPNAASDVSAGVEFVRRGALFLRQQFRGASMERLMVAAEEPAAAELVRKLDGAPELVTLRSGAYASSPGALAALGAALDADSADRLCLLPEHERPPAPTERWTRALAVASCVVLIASTSWWSFTAMQSEAGAMERLQLLRGDIARQGPTLEAVQSLIQRRQEHAQRAVLLELLTRGQHRLPEALWPLQEAAPRVVVERLNITREGSGWLISLSATARGRTSSEATDAVDALVQQVSAQRPEGGVTLGQLTYASPPVQGQPDRAAPIAVTFELSFIVPIADNLDG